MQKESSDMIRRLGWLAVGTFAVGTESFMIAGLLPYIAKDLGVSLSSAAYIVTLYATIYAIGAPILAAFTGAFNRKTILIVSILAFAAANLFAANATTYWMLFGARAVAALASALFTPTAYALAGMAVERSMQGRALALVAGGFSASIAIGAPVATLIAEHMNWRVAFTLVSVLCMIAVIGIYYGLEKPAKQPATDLRTRLLPIRDPQILMALLQFVLWLAGSFAVYVFLAPLLKAIVDADGTIISLGLFVFGVAGVIGTIVGGHLVDAWGVKRVLFPALGVIAVAPVLFSVLAQFGAPSSALVPALIILAIWGMALWALNAVQQVRLLKLAPASANLVLSLNASASYLGMAMGAAIGAATLKVTTIDHLGWIGGSFAVAAFLLLLLPRRQPQEGLVETK